MKTGLQAQAARLRAAASRLWDEVRYARAASKWEGWGRAGDPRNERPLLTREEWRRREAGL